MNITVMTGRGKIGMDVEPGITVRDILAKVQEAFPEYKDTEQAFHYLVLGSHEVEPGYQISNESILHLVCEGGGV